MSSTSAPATAPPREWMPRLWQGCSVTAWLRLLSRNRCAVGLPYVYIAAIATLASMLHVGLRHLQQVWLGDQIDRAPIPYAPLFIVGHWRTGTTLLHELLILDERHTSPNTYQCLAPHHFLLTERLFKWLFWWMMPTHRPMDNMPLGWDRPQEDEFALCMFGQPSPYLTVAFPNHPPQDQEAFDLDRLPERIRRQWRQAFLRFLRHLSCKGPRRLILKSPTHSCRIPTLLELFPDARFVHIVRDPHVVFSSTVNLWRSLYETHGLQTPTFAGLEEYVFSTFSHIYERIDQGKRLVAPRRFHEMRYEDLIRAPVEQMELLYERLEMDGFERVRPRLEKYLADSSGYQTNLYRPLDPGLEGKIAQRWGRVIRQYGYERPLQRPA